MPDYASLQRATTTITTTITTTLVAVLVVQPPLTSPPM